MMPKFYARVTHCNTTYILLDKTHTHEPNYLVFIGTQKEMEAYRTWYAQANQIKKENLELVSDDACIIEPTMGPTIEINMPKGKTHD
jgi:hypothetical protein